MREGRFANRWILELGHDAAHFREVRQAFGAADQKSTEGNGFFS